MSEEEFLSRWSRRKRKSRAEPAKPAEAQPAPPAETENAEREFDLSTLPSIDEINAATDITAFLSKHVPQELSRAALRRAWATDPAIRDFVGLAENAWDFNDPTAMPGFGPLDCSSEELAALVDRVVGGVREALQSAPDALIEAADSSPQLPQADAVATADVAEPPEATDPLAIPVAMQPAAVDRSIDHAEPIRTRTHGGALPR
ncbi:DUF3306 domain-containing protein [Bradyrhizobium sp. WBOS7]|uniref:DUF3306 domain-containing protein n=1 Tax=Bradyrhizobium betae TaxID=244734 RepID=A0AAE9NDQ9_9BRAD|nr:MULTISPECIES: DUF3306 domain-containing protein [Bradyrhizobium]MDD1571787.1 DUF3306 domain-containing protein [Bradyrhizobium sp. WBOS1]UUO36272.1 DUF3306 domain-containing protein [Bradyrhizobium sp. WBOS01]MDD1526651.1 DUF3306 domain-containing protein [Bradyrhizobium sp. WBOS2]MDD1575291.1 DUF3306 domain-containing protein [Bradyrhizobium sp. WBOS7]MDD1600754.1 DUF3306 domain-containing protein [Bradyrhizobium sp. WBOS16]